MKEQLERNRRRMTANEKATVWSTIRDGGESTSPSPRTWLKWATPIGGLATVFVFALIMADKMPSENPARGDIAAEFGSRGEESGGNSASANSEKAEVPRLTPDKKPGSRSAAAPQHKDADSSPVVQAAPAADPRATEGEDRSESRAARAGSSSLSLEGAEELLSLRDLSLRDSSRRGVDRKVLPLNEVAADRGRTDTRDRDSETGYNIGTKDLESLRPNELPEAVGLRAPRVVPGGQTYFRGGRAGETEALGDPLQQTGPATSASSDQARVGQEKTWGETKRGLDDDVSAEYKKKWGAIKGGFREGAPAKEEMTRDNLSARLATEEPVARAATDELTDYGAISRARSSKPAPDTAGSAHSLADNLVVVRPAPAEPAPLAHGGQTPPNDEVYDGMFFQHYGANPLLLTEMDPLSTFAVDVDTGAYTLMRSYIERGSLPDRNSPRVEEYVNFFDPGYDVVTESDFEIHVDGAPSPFGEGFELLRVGLQARTIRDAERRPTNLTFVIDVSGSMNRENRLGLVKQSLYTLLDSLRPEDQVAIVAYGSRAQLVLEPSSLEDRSRIREAIAQLVSGGSTNAEEGLVYGYNIARSMFSRGTNNRLILCSDGVANVGRTGPDSILERVQSEATEGIYLTTVGFGMGNYNDVLMEQLANKGDGAYFYVDRLSEAERVFTENLTGMLEVVARDAKIQVEFDPEQVLAYRLLGFENRNIADQDFRNDTVDAGEIGSGHRVLALYEIRLRSRDSLAKARELGRVRFRYADPEPKDDGTFVVHEIEASVSTSAFAREFESAPVRFRLAAVVAEYSEILRASYWSQNHTLTELLPFVKDVAFYLRRDDDVSEFARLVESATKLEEKLSPEDRQKRWPVLDAVRCLYPADNRGQLNWAEWNCDR